MHWLWEWLFVKKREFIQPKGRRMAVKTPLKCAKKGILIYSNFSNRFGFWGGGFVFRRVMC